MFTHSHTPQLEKNKELYDQFTSFKKCPIKNEVS